MPESTTVFIKKKQKFISQLKILESFIEHNRNLLKRISQERMFILKSDRGHFLVLCIDATVQMILTFCLIHETLPTLQVISSSRLFQRRNFLFIIVI